MKFNVELEVCTEFLEHGFREVGTTLALAFGKEKLQSLAAECLLHHRAGSRDGLAEVETAGGSTALKLDRSINILVIEVEDGTDGGQGFVGSATETDGHLVDILNLHA